MPINISFPSPKLLPGKKKDFPSVSARINSFGDRKAVSKLPHPSVFGAPEKPSNGSKPANARATVRTTIKKEPQQPAKKDAAKPPQPEKTKPVPFRARPVPASTYKPPFQPTVRKINKAVIEKEQAPVAIIKEPKIANEKEQAPVEIVKEPTIANEKEQASVEIVNEPTLAIDVEIAEPTHEAASCEPPKVNEPNGTNEDVCSPIELVNEPAEASSATEGARALLPDHPQGPGIPPFLPMVFIKDCIRPYVPQQWSHYTNPPDYGNLYDANGAYFWDRSMASYHCVRMSQECFYQHFPEHRVGDGALPRYDTQGYGDQSANVRVRNVWTRKPHKAEWNASYQRRLARRANERAERAAVEAQREAAEAAGPQVPHKPKELGVEPLNGVVRCSQACAASDGMVSNIAISH
ncbi:hypothetical protein OUZ56_001961 [Daphnia magna]|uniref:Uncharacterized protein n=1 Tax=Daphnia magna TaxID=35525 RepID=A0ABR0A494_9CRUS|nr:hypothetical protein OUZ56_001961 [Daphnia magna]